MSKPAVFLDRDGTLIKHYDYLTDPQQVELLPTTAAALKMLHNRGFILIVVTNQSAVARGMITEDQLTIIHDKLRSLLAERGAYVDAIYYCPYHPEAPLEAYRQDSPLRKPKPGMILQAAEKFDIDLSCSWLIGDDARDIGAGKAANVKTILLDSHSASSLVRRQGAQPDYRAVNLKEAANQIIRSHQQRQEHLGSTKPPHNNDAAKTKHNNTDTHPTKNNPQASQDDQPSAASSTSTPVEPIAEPPASPNIDKKSTLDTSPLTHDQPKDTSMTPVPPKNSNASPESKTASASTTAHQPSVSDKAPDKKKKSSQTQQLLAEILREMKIQNREDRFQDFSVAKLFAVITQMIAFLCVIIAFFLRSTPEPVWAMINSCLLLAVLFQMLTLTLLFWHRS